MPSEDYSRSVKLNISGASESFVAWLLADLLGLIGGGIVGSMPLTRTQQQAADLFQAAGAQESCRTHTSARLTSAQRSAAAVSAAEKLSSRHVLPRDLCNALKQLDDGELDRLFTATRHELQRRGRSLTTTSVIRPTTHVGTEQRASDQSTTTQESPERRQPEEPNVALTRGQVNAVRAALKAGITPSRIARQFGISQSDVRKVLASGSRRAGKGW
jgi:microcompartment protein CcmL/EutN